MILNGHNGNLVSTGDYDQLLKTTIDLIDNPSKAEQMRLTSRRYIEENFGLETMLSSYEKIITEIAK
jgi:glycosyltransferase involved in cell wall biosynthesis